MDAVARIHGDGTGERNWTRCAWLWHREVTPLHQLLGGVERICVVSPHPDDEVLACGGLLRQAMAAGLDVQIVSVTDGEACYPGDAWWTPQRLRVTRREELREALTMLGGRDMQTIHLGIDDGAVGACEHRLAARLATLIRAGTLLLAPWLRDGHPDHEACARAARAAGATVGARVLEYPVWGWHWLDPVAVRQAWPRPLLLDIRADATAKQQAIACFRTQTGAVDQLQSAPILPPNVLERFARTHEVFLG